MDTLLSVNGARVRLDVEARHTLVDVLRDELGLTGTHVGCEHGVCGACTVLVDGAPVRSCLMFAVQAHGSNVTTVEGLHGDDERLHPLQEAFAEHHGLQCGFCTPGMLMSALHLLHTDGASDRETIREELSGNICRCTGYQGIVDAVEAAARAQDAAADPDADGTDADRTGTGTEPGDTHDRNDRTDEEQS